MSKESIIKAFEGVNVRIVWDDEQEEYFFAVADIVEVLTESKDVKQYIKRMRSRDPELNAKWGTICTPVRMVAPDGKKRLTQAATMKGILRIVQSIPSKKDLTDEWEPMEQRAQYRARLRYPERKQSRRKSTFDRHRAAFGAASTNRACSKLVES